MSDPTTSRVFDAPRQMKALLAAQSWAAPSFNTALGTPALSFAAPYLEGAAEHVQIYPIIGEDSTYDESSGFEEFRLVVEITSATGADDEDDALDRIEELANVVQRALRDDTATPVAAYTSLGDGYDTRFERVDFVIGQMPDLPFGISAIATVTFRVRFRIGT